MFFKTTTIYKAYTTERGAQNYITKWNLEARVEKLGDMFYVVAGGHN